MCTCSSRGRISTTGLLTPTVFWATEYCDHTSCERHLQLPIGELTHVLAQIWTVWLAATILGQVRIQAEQASHFFVSRMPMKLLKFDAAAVCLSLASPETWTQPITCLSPMAKVCGGIFVHNRSKLSSKCRLYWSHCCIRASTFDRLHTMQVVLLVGMLG